ncbi:MAG: 4Fe-4S binding protein [Phycisphaeraceae bacterium]|nr:4Fe-4S binding protein [Phycisphaeraceae bacterium]
MKKLHSILNSWRFWRRFTQAAFLVAFLYLFRRAELGLTDPSASGNPLAYVNLAFRLDPLVAACAMLAGRAFVGGLLLSLLVVALTALLGRAFCGWVCPLGTLIDLVGKPIRWRAKKTNAPRRWWRPTRYALLVVILVSALLSLPLIGYFDPFAILWRALTVAVDPAFNWATGETFTYLYLNAPASVTAVSEPIYSFLSHHVLATRQAALIGAGLSGGILAGILLLERVERRFWCRNLCPLGALVSLIATVSPLRRKPAKACAGCRACESSCRMGVFDSQHRLRIQDCTLCMDCVENCPHQIASFTFQPNPKSPAAPLTPHPIPLPLIQNADRPAVDLSRRAFLASCATGIALPTLAAGTEKLGLSNPLPPLLRPPGAAGNPARFLDLCVRCGQCLKVCPTNALHPALLESGWQGIFSPQLIPRIGYCEYNCTLCAQVCPTEAIPKLLLTQKQKAVIGLAAFNKDRCLPYAEKTPCIVCEEHCPLPDKAIKWNEVEEIDAQGDPITLQQPYVVDDLCIGCGICENKCPLEGEPGVRVSPPKRNPPPTQPSIN